MLKKLLELPKDPIFLTQKKYLEDPNPKKINLGIGFYYDAQGNDFVFPSIQKSFQEIDTSNFYYCPIGGNKKFLDLTGNMLFDYLYKPHQVAVQQVCGGTHGVAVVAEILRLAGYDKLLIGDPTWGNHYKIFHGFDFVKINHLKEDFTPDFLSYKKAIREAEEGSVLLLHGGLTHNPTGFNLSLDEQISITSLINEKKIFTLIDFAYLGFGEGLQSDKCFAKYLFNTIDNVGIVLSFSKNASLYKQRTGAVFIKTKNKAEVESNMQAYIRRTISNPPGIGAEIMIKVYEKYFGEWITELENAREDIEQRRKMLADKLPDNFKFIKKGKGLFGLLGLSREQVERIEKEFSIYMPPNSRINFGGVKIDEIDRIAEAIREVS